MCLLLLAVHVGLFLSGDWKMGLMVEQTPLAEENEMIFELLFA
jgi:hypothetical protein